MHGCLRQSHSAPVSLRKSLFKNRVARQVAVRKVSRFQAARLVVHVIDLGPLDNVYELFLMNSIKAMPHPPWLTCG